MRGNSPDFKSCVCATGREVVPWRLLLPGNISVIVNIASLTATNYYTWEKGADLDVYGPLVCLHGRLPEQLWNSLESGSASPGTLRSKGNIWNGGMVGLRFWIWVIASWNAWRVCLCFLLVPQHRFIVFSVHFQILETSSALPWQTRCEVLAFQIMVPAWDSIHLHLETPAYTDSIDSPWGEVPRVFDAKFKLKPSWKFYTLFCSAMLSLCLHYDFYSFLSNIH